MTEHTIYTLVKAGRASEEIVLQLEAAIVAGKVKPGEKLLSERDLQVRFGTGRGAVREALKILQQKGLVEIKKGAKGGAFIRQVDVSNVGESLSLFLRQNRIDPAHLIEFRESIDRTITILAIVNGSSHDKHMLVEMTEKLTAYMGKGKPDLNALGEIDRELNILLAQMSGNPIFEWIMQAVQLGFSSYDFALYEQLNYRRATIVNWQKTAHEIKAGNTNKALSYISNHYLLLRERLENELPHLPVSQGL